ncbi:MAG: hydrogenase iron-sulfur subunit [Deltaproteobacteria bacterium]|nr:hydrogenase iron-sulfur subunit [Deltaproteobacteria bacterium]
MDIRKRSLALFYCQNVPQSGIKQRQALEKLYGPSIKLFPLPCSGRLEPRALEEFADAAYVVTCPEGACRYFEGNLRARKRVELARKIIASIGLEEDRVGIVMNEKERQKSLADFAKELMSRVSGLRPSPVLRPRTGFEDPERKQGDKL